MSRSRCKDEIGSEFWQVEVGREVKELCDTPNTKFLMSGRTAIDFVIREIKAKSSVPVTTALLPSYCCHTMIEPFIENGIGVQFYDVYIDSDEKMKFRFDYLRNYDIVFLMQYFGFSQEEVLFAAGKFKDMGAIVIEDVTHSIFTLNEATECVDYIVASFRKWSGFRTGGFAKKNGSEKFELASIKVFDEYLDLRKTAQTHKHKYILGKSNEKDFLQYFTSAEEKLMNNYKFYAMDTTSLKRLQHFNINLIRSKRRNNAETLISNIANPLIRLMFDAVNTKDCPLFVPIMVADGKRDKLRDHLINNKIYCPVHWPISSAHRLNPETSALYRDSLSLVCDQRYDKDDMCYMAQKINEFEA